jgi:hypothetical protein
MAVLLVVAGLAVDAGAQNYPRRGGGGQRGEMSKGEGEGKRGTSSGVPEPFGALERELPSMKVDLLIREEQLDDWRVFERDVRDIAEMERARKRHLMSLRESGDKAPTALTLVAALAEEDRLKSEASADLKRHVESLYRKLDDGQRRTFDRRTIQSQTEPLGPPATR